VDPFRISIRNALGLGVVIVAGWVAKHGKIGIRT
jgi:hypothetical protein